MPCGLFHRRRRQPSESNDFIREARRFDFAAAEKRITEKRARFARREERYKREDEERAREAEGRQREREWQRREHAERRTREREREREEKQDEMADQRGLPWKQGLEDFCGQTVAVGRDSRGGRGGQRTGNGGGREGGRMGGQEGRRHPQGSSGDGVSRREVRGQEWRRRLSQAAVGGGWLGERVLLEIEQAGTRLSFPF